ncbi:MAG: hypothetical protein IJ341_02555 [Bacteroidales bacterium]|nr:hypothetical protein [Bacteroidales bacterium]
MYKVGDTVRYVKAGVRTVWNPRKKPEPKTGVVEEVFSTLDKRPCYWIKGESELILGSQILGYQ